MLIGARFSQCLFPPSFTIVNLGENQIIHHTQLLQPWFTNVNWGEIQLMSMSIFTLTYNDYINYLLYQSAPGAGCSGKMWPHWLKGIHSDSAQIHNNCWLGRDSVNVYIRPHSLLSIWVKIKYSPHSVSSALIHKCWLGRNSVNVYFRPHSLLSIWAKIKSCTTLS